MAALTAILFITELELISENKMQLDFIIRTSVPDQHVEILQMTKVRFSSIEVLWPLYSN